MKQGEDAGSSLTGGKADFDGQVLSVRNLPKEPNSHPKLPACKLRMRQGNQQCEAYESARGKVLYIEIEIHK